MLTRKVSVGDTILVYNIGHFLVADDRPDGTYVGLLKKTSFVMQTPFIKVNDIRNISEKELREILGGKINIGHRNGEASIRFYDGHPVFDEYKYKVGDRFKLFSPVDTPYPDTYILASIGSNTVTLISLTDGNRWEEPVTFEHGIFEGLTETEFRLITGSRYSFTKLEKTDDCASKNRN